MAASVELPHLVAHVGATVHDSRANLTRIKKKSQVSFNKESSVFQTLKQEPILTLER